MWAIPTGASLVFFKKKNQVKSPSLESRVPETGSDPPFGSGRETGRDRLCLGEPEGDPTCEVLPRLGKEKLYLGEVVFLGEGVLCLGEPGIAAKCCFSCYILICAGWLFGKAPSTKGVLSGYVK